MICRAPYKVGTATTTGTRFATEDTKLDFAMGTTTADAASAAIRHVRTSIKSRFYDI